MATQSSSPSSTAVKVALGAGVAALLGGLLLGKKPGAPKAKPVGGGCGRCGR